MKRFVLLLILSLFFLPGCGGPKETSVSGTISWDGKPVDGVIEFEPINGGKSAAANIVSGQYEAKVSPGEKRVRLLGYKVTGTKKAYNTPDSPIIEEKKQILPAKLNEKTELTLTVTGKKQTYNYPE